MAVVYCWSGATGAANGTSWTDAYTTFGAAVTNATAGADVIYIHAGATTPHAESIGANTTYTGDNEVDALPVYAVDKDASDAAITNPETPAAPLLTFTGTNVDLTFNESWSFYGCWIRASRNIRLEGLDAIVRMENCRLDVGYGTASALLITGADRKWTHFRNTDIYFGDTGFSGAFDTGKFTMEGGSVNGVDLRGDALFVHVTGDVYIATLRGVDLSTAPFSASDDIWSPTNDAYNGTIVLDRCKLPAVAFNVLNATTSGEVEIELRNCDDSTGAFYRSEKHTKFGAQTTDTSVYHDAGWSDESGSGTGTSLSWKITPGTICKEHQPIRSMPMAVYVGSTGAKTVTVECLEDFTTALQNDEAWLEVDYLDAAGNTGSAFLSTKVVPGDAPANLTAGTGLANWTGEGGGARSVKLTAAITIGNIGVLRVVAVLGKYESGKAMWVDPKVTVA